MISPVFQQKECAMNKKMALILVGSSMTPQEWIEARVAAEIVLFGQELITSGKLTEIIGPLQARIVELETGNAACDKPHLVE